MSKKLIGFGLVMAIAFLVAFVVGCTTTSEKVTGGREYFPNEDGYSWSYRVTFASTSETATMETTFSGTSAVDSIIVQKFIMRIIVDSFIVQEEESFLQVSDAAVLGYGSPSYPTTEAAIILDFPLEVGKKWITSGTYEAEVLAIETVPVPLGSYDDCFKISTFIGSDTPALIWLAPNVGPVKMGMTMGTEEAVAELTYKSFQ